MQSGIFCSKLVLQTQPQKETNRRRLEVEDRKKGTTPISNVPYLPRLEWTFISWLFHPPVSSPSLLLPLQTVRVLLEFDSFVLTACCIFRCTFPSSGLQQTVEEFKQGRVSYTGRGGWALSYHGMAFKPVLLLLEQCLWLLSGKGVCIHVSQERDFCSLKSWIWARCKLSDCNRI